ncbi:MAG TPA: hypothetical protein VMF86_07325 [Stellaceae bacterium]|nr:hypothetical protein [Stellaceae bacterium]
MPFKPNYRFERLERERLKKAKKDEKLRRQQERTAPRDEQNPEVADDTVPPPALKQQSPI